MAPAMTSRGVLVTAANQPEKLRGLGVSRIANESILDQRRGLFEPPPSVEKAGEIDPRSSPIRLPLERLPIPRTSRGLVIPSNATLPRKK